jgi:hypothetical protein
MVRDKTPPRHVQHPWSWVGPRAFGLYLLVISIVFSIVSFLQQIDATDQRHRDAGEIKNQNSALAQQNDALAAQNRQLEGLVDCLGKWANELVTTLDARGDLSNPRLDKLFGGFKAALLVPPNQKRARKLVQQAVKLQDEYKRFIKTHQLPTPELHCELAPPLTKGPHADCNGLCHEIGTRCATANGDRLEHRYRYRDAACSGRRTDSHCYPHADADCHGAAGKSTHGHGHKNGH